MKKGEYNGYLYNSVIKRTASDLDKKRIHLYNNIKKYCESLDPEYLKTLDYTELKEFFHALEFYLPESVQMFTVEYGKKNIQN